MNESPRVARLGLLGRLAVISLLGVGCTATPQATSPIRYADLGHSPQPLDMRGPFVIEFQEGDRIPIDFDFSGEDFALSPAHPQMEFVAKHHCFARFSSEGIRVSLDPRNFGDKPKKPGSFHFGLNVQRGGTPKIDAAIATPQR